MSALFDVETSTLLELAKVGGPVTLMAGFAMWLTVTTVRSMLEKIAMSQHEALMSNAKAMRELASELRELRVAVGLAVGSNSSR